MRCFASANGTNKGTVNKNGSKTKKIASNEAINRKTNDTKPINEHQQSQSQQQLLSKPENTKKTKKTPTKTTKFGGFNDAENNTQNTKPSGTEKQADKIVKNHSIQSLWD